MPNDVSLAIDRDILQFSDPYEQGIEIASAVSFVKVLRAEMSNLPVPPNGYTQDSIRNLIDRAHNAVIGGKAVSQNSAVQVELSAYRVLADAFRQEP